MIIAAERHIEPRSAIPRDGSDAPCKRTVSGSNPLTGSRFQISGLIGRFVSSRGAKELRPSYDGTTARRRGHGEDATYFNATKNRYVGAVSLGFGPDGKRNRRKVTGHTKQKVRNKLGQ
jgi:hypothetical protein